MNYIETCTKIAVFLWRSSNYRPLKSVLHIRPGWIIYQNMRETWEKKVMKFEREIPIGLDARRKNDRAGWKSPPPPPPPPNGIRVKVFMCVLYYNTYHFLCSLTFPKRIYRVAQKECNNFDCQFHKHLRWNRIVFYFIWYNRHFQNKITPWSLVLGKVSGL